MPIFMSGDEWGRFVAEHSGYWLSIDGQPWAKVTEEEYRSAFEHVQPWRESTIEPGTTFETMETATGRSVRGTTVDPTASSQSLMEEAEMCGSCRHWDKAPRPPRVAGAEHADRILPGEWGTCERIIRYGDSSHEVPPTLDEPTDDPAYLSDGSGYFASLTTRSDFGCALWETQADGAGPGNERS